MSAVSSTAIIDAFYLCLAASIAWAPIVFVGASFLNRRSGGAAEATVWPTALSIAVLPVLAAPIAAAFGWSLRTTTPLPPMSAAPTTAFDIPAAQIITVASEPAISVAMVLNAAADLYFYGFILFAALGVIRLIGFSYRVRYSEPVTDAKLLAELDQWRRAIGVRAPVRYAYTDAVSSVCVHGFHRPVVLMPPSLLERATPKDAILMGAHELAHVKRGDTWLFAFCGFAKALFWFNPFMRRIVAHAQLAAEQAADALVIKRGVSRQSYARCFVESLKLSSGLSAPQYELVPSFTPFDKRSRRKRLDAILSGRGAEPVISLGAKAVLIASGMLALVLAFGQAALAVTPSPAKEALTVVPVDGRVTSEFGERAHPIDKTVKFHSGIDIAAPTGTPVKAAGAGKIVAATTRYNDSDAWGNVVVIDHGHGLVTRYAQLDSYIVHKGDSVVAGDLIGSVGATGRATGPHLHFEVLLDGDNIDPAPVIGPDAPAAPIPHTTRKAMLSPIAPEIIAPTAPLATETDRVIPSPALTPPVAPNTETRIAPAPEPIPAPTPTTTPAPAPAPPADIQTLGERLEHRLAGQFGEWAEHFDENFQAFEDFDPFQDFSEFGINFSDLDVRAIEGAEEIVVALQDLGLNEEDWEGLIESLPGYAFVIDESELSEGQRRQIEKARKKAEQAREKALRAAERAKENAHRQIERAQRQVEREVERALLERERSMRDAERSIQDREREFQDMERDLLDNADETERSLFSREKDLHTAEAELAEQRNELERTRAELEATRAVLEAMRTQLEAQRRR